MSHPRDPVPDDVLGLARRRAAARERHEWSLADELKASIEAAGWKVVDAGSSFGLTPARPPDLGEPGRTLYGSAASVPSHLSEPPQGVASFVLHRVTPVTAGLRHSLTCWVHGPEFT